MPFINHIANRLADIVIADRKTFQAVFFQNIAAPAEIGILTEHAFDVEVIAPAGKLDSVVAKFSHFLTQCLEWNIPPLATRDRNRTRHIVFLFR